MVQNGAVLVELGGEVFLYGVLYVHPCLDEDCLDVVPDLLRRVCGSD